MTLHWVIALGILVQIAMGWSMTTLTLPLSLKFQLYQLHKSIGLTVLAAVLLRVLWRLWHKPPALPAAMRALERFAAHGMHYVLYGLMFFLPLTGWLVASVSPLHIPIVLYGRVPWPMLPVPAGWVSQAADDFTGHVHEYAAYILLALVAVHAAAALRHHFFVRDDVLSRMLPFTRRVR